MKEKTKDTIGLIFSNLVFWALVAGMVLAVCNQEETQRGWKGYGDPVEQDYETGIGEY